MPAQYDVDKAGPIITTIVRAIADSAPCEPTLTDLKRELAGRFSAHPKTVENVALALADFGAIRLVGTGARRSRRVRITELGRRHIDEWRP